MKQLWQRISQGRDFSVVFIADEIIRGIHFCRRGNAWQVKKHVSESVSPESPDMALSTVMHDLGATDFCAVTGKISGALFFRFTSTELPVAAQRGAVEFELPRRLLSLPEKYQQQFTADVRSASDGSLGVNVAVLPSAETDSLIRKLEKAGGRADEFIYPFLAVSPELPALYLPEVEKEFFFADGMWSPVNPGTAAIYGQSVEYVKKYFALPGDFPAGEFLPELVCGTLIASGRYHRSPESFRILPEKVRPVRCRKHLIISALLGILLIANIGWQFSRTYGGAISEYRAYSKEVKKLKSETTKAKSTVKRSGKELKEIMRVVEMNPGETEAVREFGMISMMLPADVMVSSMRWSDTDIDMVLQCENDKLDLPSLIQPLKRWKIAQLQQRQAGDSAVATINLKLVPIDAADKNKKEAKR